MYKVPKDNYNKLLKDNTTAAYRKSDPKNKKSIDLEAKAIAKEMKLDTRIDRLAEKDAFVTIKDHKDNFPNTIKCRLVNPAKTEIGKISKKHLENTNLVIRQRTGLKQWRNTSSVITWFKSINEKKKCKFLQLDIIDFYPSISEMLLQRALVLAKSIDSIDADMIKTTLA